MEIHGVGVCLRGGGPPGVDYVPGCFMHFCHAARFGLVELLIDFCHWCLDNYLDKSRSSILLFLLCYVTNFTCYEFYMLRILHVTNFTCYEFYMLRILQNFLCYEFY